MPYVLKHVTELCFAASYLVALAMEVWRLVAPRLAEGTVLGVEIGGRWEDPAPSGSVRQVVGSRSGGEAYFAPLITNATSGPLTVTVNAGLAGAISCGCAVPPGSARMRIGYYPLYQNSSVRVEDGRGRSATFSDLGPKVEPVSGVVGLRFEDRDLR